MRTDGIIFDLDGTLWDSSKNILISWNESLKNAGVDRVIELDELQACLGLPMDEIFKRLLSEQTEEEQKLFGKKLEEFENDYLSVHGGILYDGLEDTLKVLSAKYPLMIVSNCQVGYIEAFMKAHHMEKYFVDFESFGNTGLMKDANMKLIAKRNHLQHPVYVGDIQKDADATHAAGFPFIHAAYGFGEVSDAEARIDQVSDLLTVITE